MFILTGMKHCGKSTTGALLAQTMQLPFYDLDREIEKHFAGKNDIPIREIYAKEGIDAFKKHEMKALRRIVNSEKNNFVLSLGGGTIENNEAIAFLKDISGVFIFLDVEEHILFDRIRKKGIPPFLSSDNPEASFHTLFLKRVPLYQAAADIIIRLQSENQESAVNRILEKTRSIQ